MKGKHTVVVRNRRVQFTLELERNITIIKGNSATGKTTLIGMLQDYETQGKQSGVVVETDVQCRVLTASDWENRLSSIENTVVFIDEGNAFVSSQAFAATIMETSNYYVLITRESLYQLPYSIESVLELRETSRQGKYTCNHTYPYYKALPHRDHNISQSDIILTEDSNAGHQMFSHIGKSYGKTCVSAQGKSNIYKKLDEMKDKHTLVVADGAAFGADMEKVYQFQKQHPFSVTLYLPESFEWLILKAGIIRSTEIEEILENPSEHIESADYFSWEQYFTALLIRLTSDQDYMRYNKQKLSDFYLQEGNVLKVLKTMSEE